MDVLGIPVVIQTVLQHLSTRDVANCRFISTLWNDEAIKILKNRVVIHFNAVPHLKRFADMLESPNRSSSISLPFQKFYFGSDLYSIGPDSIGPETLRLLQENNKRFVQLTCDQVTELSLVICPPTRMEQEEGIGSIRFFPKFTDMVERIFQHFEELQSLKLLLTISDSQLRDANGADWISGYLYNIALGFSKSLPKLTRVQVDVETAPGLVVQWNEDGDKEPSCLEPWLNYQFITKLMISAPNLKSISCNSKSPPLLLQRALFKSFPEMTADNLQEIEVPLLISPEILAAISIPKWSVLSRVHFQLPDNLFPIEEPLKTFLLRRRTSLEIMRLDFDRSSPGYSVELPMGVAMDKLSWLILGNFGGSVAWGRLPSLKRLTLNKSFFERVLSSGNTLSSPVSLETLEILEGTADERFCVVFTQVAPIILPNLTELTITKVPDTLPLPVIFKEGRRLRRLTIQKCGGVSDSVLCGMRASLVNIVCPMEPLQEIVVEQHSAAVFRKMVEVAKGAGIASARESPYIGDVKGLQLLTLEGAFSDVAVLYGIIHCDGLIRLNLTSEICTWRTLQVIRQAKLLHLVDANVNGQKLGQQ